MSSTDFCRLFIRLFSSDFEAQHTVLVSAPSVCNPSSVLGGLMKVVRISMAALLVLLTSISCFADICRLSNEEKNRFLSMDLSTFDQSHYGWRSLGSKGCHSEAAKLIVHYLEKFTAEYPDDKRILIWHAGQNFASGGEYPKAKALFLKSFDDGEHGPMWNLYVSATIAFVDRDKAALDAKIKEFQLTVNHPDH